MRHSRGTGPNDDVSKIKDACDIVRLIGEHLAIKPKGREYVSLCPFHDDHNPSMRIIPSKQIFHCFVCGTGGDVFSFIQKFHKMDFVESLQFLAERTGITLTPRKARDSEQNQGEPSLTRRQVTDAAQVASDFYRTILRHPEHGAAGRAIVAKRGITPEMVELFQIGAAPNRFDGLVRYAEHKNIDPQALMEAGLFKPRESGGVYDLLRHRLIFPIHDRTGRVIAFGGRRINDEDEPKYINSPETRLFSKSATLYALHLASRAIQAEKTAIVTEGYMDALACHQGGFSNTVATLGTALTKQHASTLRLLCDTVVLLFDGDDAGQRAADRTVPIFFSEPIDVKIATLSAFTDAKDPDELLKREGGAAIFRTVLAKAVDLLDYRFARVREQLRGSGMAGLSKAIAAEMESMVDMGLRDVEPIRQRLIIKKLAALGGMDESTIRRAIPAGRSPRVFAPVNAEGEAAAPVPARNLASVSLTVHEHLLGCILCDGALWASMGEADKDSIAPSALEYDELRPLSQLMLDIAEDGGFPGLDAVLAGTMNDAVKSAAVVLASRIEDQTEGQDARLRSHWQACLTRARLDAHRTSPGQHVEIKNADDALGGPGAGPNEVAPRVVRSAIERIMERKALLDRAGPDRRVLPRKD
jgi:DNA primase